MNSCIKAGKGSKKNSSKKGKFTFVEVIPTRCHFDDLNAKLFKNSGDEILKLLKKAKKTIKAISFYFTLRGSDVEKGPYPTATRGEAIFDELENAAKRTTKSEPLHFSDQDYIDFKAYCPTNFHLRHLDMTNKSPGLVGGICHTKLWIVDDVNFYLGSSNADWRAYSEVVETGIVGTGANCAVTDLLKIFEESWEQSEDYDSSGNFPLKSAIKTSGKKAVQCVPLISSSPGIFSKATSTPQDLDTLLSVINDAKKVLFVTTYRFSVMDAFIQPQENFTIVRDSLKAAAERGVDVKMIVDHSVLRSKDTVKDLRNLTKSQQIKVGLFGIGGIPHEEIIPFANLWHSKVAVSESKLWITTNNLQRSYFAATAGASIMFDTSQGPYKSLLKNAVLHFERYWKSQYIQQFHSISEKDYPTGKHEDHFPFI